MVSTNEINAFFESFERLMLKLQEVDNWCVDLTQDISKQGLSLVGFVGEKETVIMRDIAEFLAVPFSTATGIVDKLVEINYLERFNSAEDRRIVLVKLGDKGHELNKLFITKKCELGELVLCQLNKEERKSFIQLMDKVKLGLMNGHSTVD
ncbi:winged helix DNA-binding protein [Fulvivirga sp. M361]|uniref:MarR family winged helix-turn-helix transcriptional regulator n=1 Tax=Fulvivirga sp. M361 TaxID=2594266 RepID=UPI00117A2564|nr:MarR family transcriptional regulator [Fulvivirga sp. M361]TRX60777.1 winged helix DNA-binding protein [Fulvivirga sp. M361]